MLDSIQELWYYIGKVVKGNECTTNYIRRLLNENEAEQKAYCRARKIGYKKQSSSSGYIIKKYTRMYNCYRGDYTVIVSNYATLNVLHLYGNHADVHLYRY